MKEEQESIGGYRLISISEVSSFVDATKYPIEVKPEDHRLNFKVGFVPLSESSTVVINFGVGVVGGVGPEFPEFISATLQFVFEIELFDKLLTPTGDDDAPYACDRRLLEVFVSMMIGTMRGFLIAKTQGVINRGYMLGPFVPSELTDLIFAPVKVIK